MASNPRSSQKTYQIVDSDSDEDFNMEIEEEIQPTRARAEKRPRSKGKEKVSSSFHSPRGSSDDESSAPLDFSIERKINDKFANRAIVDHHFIDEKLFNDYFPRVMQALAFQSLITLLTLNEPIILDHVREFYSNAKFKTDKDYNTYIETYVYGQNLKITEILIHRVLNIEVGGDFWIPGYGHCPIDEANRMRQLYVPGANLVDNRYKWPMANKLHFEFKILHFIFVKCIRPISSSFNDVNPELAWHILKIFKNEKLNIPHLIIAKMKECINHKTHRLPYGSLISVILKRAGIPLGINHAPNKAHSKISKVTFSQMYIKVHKHNIIFWDGVQVTGKNFVPLTPDEQQAIYASLESNPPIQRSSSTRFASSSQTASLSRSKSYKTPSSSKSKNSFSYLKTMCKDTLKAVLRIGKQVREQRKDFREIHKLSVYDGQEDEDLDNDLYVKYLSDDEEDEVDEEHEENEESE